MKRILLLSAIASLLSLQTFAQTGVAINATGAEPDTSAMLDVSSAIKGILIPRMTEAERSAIALPAKGLLVYQTDVAEGFYYFDGTAWRNLSLVNFTDHNFTYDLKTGVSLQPALSESDVDVVMSPKGNGAVLAQQPDGLASGGDNRGKYAIDWQRNREVSDQVASGDFSLLIGGMGNKASGLNAAVVGGGCSFFSVPLNTWVIKGNTASGTSSFVGGGILNTATGNHSFIAGGSSNTASGGGSLVGGGNNSAQTYFETVFGIGATTVSGDPDHFVLTDRLFTVGNGSLGSRSNALSILKNANTTIGGSLTINGNGTNTSYLFPETRGASGQFLKTQADGTTSWAPAQQPGTAPGQMQYWNGTAWVTVAPGTTGQLLSVNSSGIPQWQSQLSIITASTHTPTMTSSGVTFKGVVNPNNLYAAHLFEYGTTTDYGNTTETTYYNPISTNQTISSSPVTGLTLGITYHVRLVTQTILGTFYSNDITFTYLYPGAPLYFGATYQEGIVFYLDESGEHGKVCAFYDQSASATWYDAFEICTAYSSGTVAPFIYDDWYLPSSTDLTLMYNNLKLNNSGSFSNSFYWSFEAFNDTDAFYVNFVNGNVTFGDKNANYKVRAVRDF